MKKGNWTINPGVAFFILIIVLIIITMFVGSWECKNDNDCDQNEICTVKHTCYKLDVKETTIIKTEYNFAAFIIGICIIIAAIIFKEDFKLSHHIHRIRKK